MLEDQKSEHGDLIYHRVQESGPIWFEELVLSEIEAWSQDERSPFILECTFRDYDRLITKRLPHVDDRNLEKAVDWFHEVQEGDLVQVTLKPKG